jgi:hypothetical protein
VAVLAREVCNGLERFTSLFIAMHLIACPDIKEKTAETFVTENGLQVPGCITVYKPLGSRCGRRPEWAGWHRQCVAHGTEVGSAPAEFVEIYV